jgi:hypothetical protein
VEHLFTECPRTQIIFKNFEQQYCIKASLTKCEKMTGVDTNMKRENILHKRLGIMRKNIYDCNHNGTVPRWENMLRAIDRVYVLEYAIAEQNGRVDRVLKVWDL